MPARDEGRSRSASRRVDLLRALLELEETEADAHRHPPRPPGTGGLGPISADKLQGFLWGMGAATLLLMILPSAKTTLRPLAVATLKGSMDLADRVKQLFGEAGEGLADLFAEVQFERMKETLDPVRGDGPTQPQTDGASPG